MDELAILINLCLSLENNNTIKLEISEWCRWAVPPALYRQNIPHCFPSFRSNPCLDRCLVLDIEGCGPAVPGIHGDISLHETTFRPEDDDNDAKLPYLWQCMCLFHDDGIIW